VHRVEEGLVLRGGPPIRVTALQDQLCREGILSHVRAVGLHVRDESEELLQGGPATETCERLFADVECNSLAQVQEQLRASIRP